MRKLLKIFLTVLIMILSTGCQAEPKETRSIDPEATLPYIGAPEVIETLPDIGVPDVTSSGVEITEISTTEEETTEETTEVETTIEETTEVITTTVDEATTEETTEEEIIAEVKNTVAEETTVNSRYIFTQMDVHMYVQKSVNIRTEPSMEGSILFVLDVNDIVYVTGKNERGWYRIDVEGQTLYVYSDYVGTDKVVSRSATTPTTTKSTQSTKTYPTSGFVYYKVAGRSPNRDYEAYLYNQLKSLGIAWWYPYAIAQIWQESCWNPNSTNGRDHGICQFKGIYFQSRAEHFAGMKNADIWNPYDSLKVYAYYIKAILVACNNKVDATLSYYICGDPYNWDQVYINHVMGWYNQLQAA